MFNENLFVGLKKKKKKNEGHDSFILLFIDEFRFDLRIAFDRYIERRYVKQTKDIYRTFPCSSIRVLTNREIHRYACRSINQIQIVGYSSKLVNSPVGFDVKHRRNISDRIVFVRRFDDAVKMMKDMTRMSFEYSRLHSSKSSNSNRSFSLIFIA
jgi:hypothetical protein